MKTNATVCLDAGHYGNYNRSPVLPEYYESHMAWTLQQLLKTQLESYGITVTTTRSDRSKDLPLVERGKKSKGADLFVSLHSNAATSPNPDWVVGICQVQNERSRLIATVLSEAAANVMGLTYQITTKASAQDRDKDGRKDDYYGVLRGATQVGTTGVILEHGFHTNEANTRWLMKQSNLEKLAEAEAKAIATWLGMGEKLVQISVPVLKRGMKNDSVRALQALLAGYGSEIDVDGSFGPATDKLVRAYQTVSGLTVDGSVGPATWNSLLGR